MGWDWCFRDRQVFRSGAGGNCYLFQIGLQVVGIDLSE